MGRFSTSSFLQKIPPYLDSTNENTRNETEKILLLLHVTTSPRPPTNLPPFYCCLPLNFLHFQLLLLLRLKFSKPHKLARSMACATFFAAAPSLTGTIPRRSGQQTFFGLRPMKASVNSRDASVSWGSGRKRQSSGVRRGGVVGVKAELNTSLVISLSTGLSLFLGRFVFFNFQRENVAKQVPEQNGVTHFEAGDTRAKEYASLLKSNDPVGFNIVDVLAWGSIGHIVAYYILATSSNGYDPSFFG